jgi:hypothetical protein
MGFVMAGAIAGSAGGLYVILLNSLSPGAVPPTDSLTVFSYAVIGGLGSIVGALGGIFFFKYLETVHALGDLRNFITGFVLLIVLYVIPGGIGQIIYNLRDRALRVIADRRGIVVPSLLADRRDGEGDADEASHAADEVSLLAGALGGGPNGAAPNGSRSNGAAPNGAMPGDTALHGTDTDGDRPRVPVGTGKPSDPR